MAYLDWRQENNQWFCYKDNQKIIGWISDDKNKWYHLNNKNGQLDIGWFQTATDNDLWFYGYTEKTEKDGETHYLGECAVNWLEIDGKYYYFYPEKTEENGQTHYQCEMGMGWIELDDKYYYLLTESDVPKGEYKGQMIASCSREINGKSYTFGNDGVLVDNSSSDGLVSDEGAEFVGSWEGLYTTAYEDPYYPGNQSWWTIGYGTTYAVTPEAFPNGLQSTCTKSQAVGWLKDEMGTCAKSIKSKLDSNNITLNTNQFQALCSFAYNCGTGALFNSTLWKNICGGVTDRDTISANFCAYSKANGVTSTGLLKRRESEVSLYFDGNYTGNN